MLNLKDETINSGIEIIVEAFLFLVGLCVTNNVIQMSFTFEEINSIIVGLSAIIAIYFTILAVLISKTFTRIKKEGLLL